ncbi:hypothetical protein K504DRAFT_452992 [Pleomassaria siparia CBS 279.74]|uniref:Uncharacterized protein n=1 Tax=Pleomassaria siparia CBS 279.74 TaxID=1314801 RepID=A0A6G1JR95_9PLEO|nr:hypothetical protein K504DRAFT_452992 [Pleomassaria siparia CBS 279.74]
MHTDDHLDPYLPSLLTWATRCCSPPSPRALSIANHGCQICTGEFNTEFEWGAIQTAGCPCNSVIGGECLYEIASEGLNGCLKCGEPWWRRVGKRDAEYERVMEDLRGILVGFERNQDDDDDDDDDDDGVAKGSGGRGM